MLRALQADAAWFLVRPTPPEDLIGLVQVAAEGHTVLSPAAARRLIVASASSSLITARTASSTGAAPASATLQRS